MPLKSEPAGGHPLRVAQLIETMAMGGAEQLAVRIANHLAAAGHESHLIVLTGPGVLSERIASGVQVHYLEFARASISNPVRFAASLRRGLGLIRQVVARHDIAVVQSHLPGANFFGLLLAWRRVCAVVPTIHNNQEFNYGDVDNSLLLWLRKRAYRQLLRRSQGAVAVSREVRDSLIAELAVDAAAAERICVATNAVAIPAPITTARRAGIRQGFGCGTNEVLLLAAGRFCEQKNFDDLVEAAALLQEAGTVFRLVIGGDGEQRDDLAARVRERGLADVVLLPGNLTNLGEVMQSADIFVMSSLWEGLPLVLLEAMAAGLPVVAYDIPGIVEVVAEGQSGLLARVGEPQELADGLATLSGDPARRLTMGDAGLEIIRTRFGFPEYMDLLIGQYERAASLFKGGVA